MKHLFAAVPLLAFSAAATASIAFGTLGNFDTVNDTGVECHGFEIELDDIHSTSIGGTYNFNHYGAPKIREDNTDPAHPKTFIRYESAKDATGKYLAFTAVPAAPLPATQGHQCTNPGVNLGCEHFGVGIYYAAFSIAKYNWLVDDGAGNLIHGPAVNVALPSYTFVPAVGAVPAQVLAVLPAPEPPEVHAKEFGDAVWVKSIITSAHNNNHIPLEDLRSDDPNNALDKNWQNGEVAEVETEFEVLQKDLLHADQPKANAKGKPEQLPKGDEIVTRRYEFYKYLGPFDQESNEALCDSFPNPNPNPKEPACAGLGQEDSVGDYIGAQMAAFDEAVPLGLVEKIQDGTKGQKYPDRLLVVGGNTPYVTAITAGALPAGMSLDSSTGVLSGTPTALGKFSFTVKATDADNSIAALAIPLNIVAVVVRGDVDKDGDIDLNDLNLMKTRFGQRSTGAGDLFDVNGDGVINVLDFRKAISQCTRPKCAVEAAPALR